MKAKKFYINRENTVVITCPSCSGITRMPLAKFKRYHNLKARCRCNHTFAMDVVFRRAYRREVTLTGSYKDFPGDGTTWFDMKIRNVSKTGIGFSSLDTHSIKVGDRLKVKFTLDDDQQSEIESVVVAMKVDDICIGSQFIGYMQPNHKSALDSFLML